MLAIVQNIFLTLSIGLLALLPLWVAFGNGSAWQGVLYQISFIAVFFVMLIRPLADIFLSQKWLHQLVILRKGVGIFSASIVVALTLGDMLLPDSQYLSSIFTLDFWSFRHYKFFAHLGDLSGVILLITSNNFSMIILKKNWKRIQKLAYVYFYAGGIYEAYALGNFSAFVMMSIVTISVVIAFVLNLQRRMNIIKG